MNRQLVKAIEALKAKVKLVPEMVDKAGRDITTRAQGSAPTDVRVTYSDGVITAEDALGIDGWAVWTEFGTGQFAARYTATLPENWDEYASRFILTGEGTIPDGNEYLYPAFKAVSEDLIEDIKKLFNGR